MLEKFMHEWLYVSDYDVPVANNGFNGRASVNGVDLESQYVALVATSKTKNLPEWRLAFNLDDNKRVYVMKKEHVSGFLNNISNEIYVGVGGQHYDLSGSIKEGFFALLLTNYIEQIVYYDGLIYLEGVVLSSLEYPSVQEQLLHVDEETQLTLWFYLKQKSSIAELAGLLMVHPKTVRYRLQKIYAQTGLNPSCGIDIVPLLVAYLRNKTRQLQILKNELQSFSDNMLPRDKTMSLNEDS